MFGADVEIITINLGSSGHNIVAMKPAAVSSNSNGWTEHLTIFAFFSGDKAVIKLLCESEELLREKHDINADIDTKETITA